MSARLRLLWAIFAVVCAIAGPALGQTPSTGWILISGSVQGPVYPCGKSSCPTYDTGQITITVANFTATASYTHTAGQSGADGLTKALTAQLNSAASPVTAVRSSTKISLTSKLASGLANYSLVTSVTHSPLFSNASFSATPSGPTLTGATGGPYAAATLVQQTANSTSACSSTNDPAGNLSYCISPFNGFGTNSLNLGSETSTPDTAAGHVSNLSIKQLIYPGWNGKLLCEYQPWFGSTSHKSVGYNENSSATAAAQDSFMIAEGCDIVLVDYYGALDPKQAFNLTTTNTIFSDVTSRAGYPLNLGIMEDKGALKSTCPTSAQTETATVTCLQNSLISEMDYINLHYAYSPAYWNDAGQPVVAYFGGRTDWPILTSADWSNVWTAVKAHTDLYAGPFKFIFQYGTYTTSSFDNGRYGWPQPSAYSSTQQFWWGSATSASPTYLDSFYGAGLAHPSQLTIGVIYKGFDDNNASWGGNRVVAQQCGQVLLKTTSEIGKYFGGSNPQIPYVQFVTWNDYEEGTAAEDGIDNCYTVSPSISGSVVSWSLVASDPTYATPATLHHFNVYFADSNNNLYLAAGNLPVAQNSLDLSNLVPPGTWNVYVEMVGQPLIMNRMSPPVTLTH